MILSGLSLLCLALIPAWVKRSALFTALIWLACICLASGFARILFAGSTEQYLLPLGVLPFSLSLIADPLAAFFGLIFALGFPLGILYGHHYTRQHPEKGLAAHLFWLGLLMISMFLVLLLRHSLLFLLAWEVMSLASFFAILYARSSSETRDHALYYFVMMHLGAAVLLCGFGLAYLQTGAFSLADTHFMGAAKWLLLIGFAFKAGFFPFYSWLPKAHPVAPAHLSGMMSGLMIKTGIFGIILVLHQAQWQAFELYILLGISLLTAFSGIVHALTENNLKRSLAYSSIENIGIIGVGLSFWQLGLCFGNPLMAALGLAGALLHTFFHSLFKPLLFYLSGNVLLATHSLDTNILGGLQHKLPKTTVLFLMGSMGISALPLFNGFISEFTIFGAILGGFNPGHLASTLCSVVAGAVLAFVSALALIAFSKLFSIVFLGHPRSQEAANATELKAGLLISPAILAVLCAGLGVFGNLGLQLVTPLGAALGSETALLIPFAHTLNGITIVLLMLIAGFSVLYFLKRTLGQRSTHGTWACGYWKNSPRLQYTGPAYINPLAYFLKPLLKSAITQKGAEGYFPERLDFKEEMQDYLDKSFIAIICKSLRRFLAIFGKIQNGKINSYITYLLLALLALLFWVLGMPK